MTNRFSYISRTLTWYDAIERQQKAVEEGQVLDRPGPIVILAPPGMGKTRLLEKLGQEESCRFIRAGSFLRLPDAPLANEVRIIIDGLDEVAAVAEGDPLHNVLKKLQACGKPPFIISCREAEWRNVTASLDIADDYGAAPLELTLEPLSSAEAVAALSEYVDAVRADEAIRRLQDVGLSELFANPLTLEFVAAIIEDDGDIPETRAELYANAVGQLRKEPNQRLQGSKLASLSEDEALDAAGAIMAVMLLTGKDSVTIEQTNLDAISISDISDIHDAAALRAVLSSNLFRRDNALSGTFRALHRTVSENLAARWLARMIEAHGNSQTAAARLFALMTVGDGIPASLRGMAAWLPRFSPMRLGPKIIAADPYAVLRYGDPDNLSPEQAEQMINAFEKLAESDLYFRQHSWAHLSAKGLVQPALKQRISELIFNGQTSYHLRTILLDAIEGSAISAELVPEFSQMLHDSQCSFGERIAAFSILEKSNAGIDWVAEVRRLLSATTDAEADRLAINIISRVGCSAFDPALIAEAVVAHSGLLDPKHDDSIAIGSIYLLRDKVADDQIIPLLEEICSKLESHRDPKKWWETSHRENWREVSDFADHLIARQLQSAPDVVSPEELWRWMRSLEREENGSRDNRSEIASFIAQNTALRQEIQRLIFFADGSGEDYFSREHHAARLSNGLRLQEEDARVHLRELVARNLPSEERPWHALVNYFRSDGRVPKDIQKIALPYAGANQQRRDFVTKKPKRPPMDEWDKKYRRRDREREQRRTKNWQTSRENFSLNLDAVRNGDLRWIHQAAMGYLGRYSDLKAEGPVERLDLWLGEEIRNACLEGFEAALHRHDLPSADEVAQSFAKRKVWHWVYPLIAGVAERILAGKDLDDLTTEVLAIVDVAMTNSVIGDSKPFDGLSAAVDTALRNKADHYEKTIRQKFEPVFAEKQTHVPGLYPFLRAKSDAALAAMLCAEWLNTFPELPLGIEEELSNGLLNAPLETQAETWGTLRSLIAERENSFVAGSEREMVWRSLQFIVDFEGCLKALPTMMGDNRNWLWALSKHLHSRWRDERKHPAKPAQLQWLIAAFRKLWPQTSRPTGMTSGSENEWDATDLLRWAIYELATDAGEDAIKALATLRAMPDDGYTEMIQDAIAQQRRLQIDSQFLAPDRPSIKAVIQDSAPQSAHDLQAIVVGALRELQKRLRGDPLNVVNNFYKDNGEHKDENSCRDQMLIALGQLPYGIQNPPEAAMPQGNRADGAFSYHQLALPLEVKGQWHPKVWSAASSQLDSLYASDYRAGACGVYVVLWFGNAVKMQKPPKSVPLPKTATEMEEALCALIPPDRQAAIQVVVLDATRPKK